MKLRPILLVVAAVLLGAAIVLPQGSVQAFATVSSASHGCGTFTASGTTNQPYVSIYAYISGTAYFSIVAASGGAYSASLSFPEQPAGTVIHYEVWGTPNLYTNIGDSGYWDLESFYSANVACGGSFAGPGVPAGWTQRWMTCSSAVFDSPGGKPVGNDAVWAGQSFYVNPETKKDASGKSWSQVFVSSYISPWIPTSCVG